MVEFYGTSIHVHCISVIWCVVGDLRYILMSMYMYVHDLPCLLSRTFHVFLETILTACVCVCVCSQHFIGCLEYLAFQQEEEVNDTS